MGRVLSTMRAGPGRLVLLYWLPVLLYASLIFYFSSLPYPEEKLPDFLLKRVSDKLLHLVEYCVLAGCFYPAFRWAAGPTMARHAMLLTIVATALYGISDEVHQAFVPFRESSWLDWVADTFGGVIGAMGSRWFMGERGSGSRDKV